jgi:hypothetical protein
MIRFLSSALAVLFYEKTQNIVQRRSCRFAPEGRDVYSLDPSLDRSSVGAQALLPATTKVQLPVSLLTERGHWTSLRSYEYLARAAGAKTN